MSGKQKVAFLMLLSVSVLVFYFFACSTRLLEIKIVPSKTSFRKGEVAHFEFYLVGTSNLFFGSIKIPSLNYEVKVVGPTGPVYAKQEFVHRTEPVTVFRGSEIMFGKFDWNLSDLSGKTVTTGTYRIMISLFDYELKGEISVEIVDH